MRLTVLAGWALAASGASAIMRAITDNSGDGSDRPPIGTLNSRALAIDHPAGPPGPLGPTLQARSATPPRLAPRRLLRHRKPGKPKPHHKLTKEEQHHLEEGLKKVGKPVKKGSRAALTVACLLGFVLPPPADLIVEGGCLAETVAEAGGKAIKHRIDKKKGIAPPPKPNDGQGILGDLRALHRGGDRKAQVHAVEDVGKKSGKFLLKWGTKVHIKRSARASEADRAGARSRRR